MMDLERFFRELVSRLGPADAARLRQPLMLNDVMTKIMPYRSCRRALDLATVDDYEMLLLRLAAGEHGLARSEPLEASEAFQAELASRIPELSILRVYTDAELHLQPGPVALALTTPPDLAYAPPEMRAAAAPPPEPVVTPEPEIAPEPEPTPVTELQIEPAPVGSGEPAGCCETCGCQFPEDRIVNFCPRCGQGRTELFCPMCREPADPDWRFCIVCGHGLGAR
ncbi:MAG TPA: zinc ribbon domain-containing protein [Gemmatimonadales bacterium]|nr:zinc ribbon domain-containing protein [Gemmatimonadales bacterium]